MKKKKPYKKPITKNILLPTSIVNVIEKNWSSESKSTRVKNRNVIAYRIASTIYSGQRDYKYFVAIPSAYFMKLFASIYREVLFKLIDEGVIETFASETSQASYLTTATAVKYTGNPKAKGLSKKYRISKDFYTPLLELNDELGTSKYIVYKSNYKKPVKKKETTTPQNTSTFKRGNKATKVKITYSPKKSAEEYEKEFIKNISSIEINTKKIEEEAKKKIDDLNEKDYIVSTDTEDDDNVYVKVYFLKRKITKYHSYKLNRIKQEVNKTGELLFKDKDSYYVGTLEQFRDYKKHNMTVSYSETLNALKKSDFYAKRNGNNNRLDTNFTNMPNFMLDIIKEDNNLESMDLKNSQISILSYILENSEIKDTPDFLKFRELCYNGKIYDVVAEKKNISRSEAKTGFFEVLFGRVNGYYQVKPLLKEMFPSVIKWTDDYKTKHTYKCLARLLQTKESEIFIDNIYERLNDELDFILTKHDSVIYEVEDREKVQRIIQDFFKEINFRGKMAIE